jgi:hypothetical protein
VLVLVLVLDLAQRAHAAVGRSYRDQERHGGSRRCNADEADRETTQSVEHEYEHEHEHDQQSLTDRHWR